jgi:hypothetical protein
MQSPAAQVLSAPKTGLTWIKAPGPYPTKIEAAEVGQEETIMSRVGWAQLLSLAVLFAALGTQSAGAADPGRGQALYESRCTGCHNKSVHQRDSRKATTFEGILAQVSRWNETLGGDWKAEDMEDVAAYLNQRYYKLPCPPAICPGGRASLSRPESASSR